MSSSARISLIDGHLERIHEFSPDGNTTHNISTPVTTQCDNPFELLPMRERLLDSMTKGDGEQLLHDWSRVLHTCDIWVVQEKITHLPPPARILWLDQLHAAQSTPHSKRSLASLRHRFHPQDFRLIPLDNDGNTIMHLLAAAGWKWACCAIVNPDAYLLSSQRNFNGLTAIDSATTHHHHTVAKELHLFAAPSVS